MDKDSAAALIAVLADRDVRTAIADSAVSGAGADYINGPKSGGPFQMSYPAARRLLHDRPAGWFADYDGMLLGCLRDAVREGQRMQGRNLGKWRYGNYLRLEIDHPILKQLPGLGGYFNIGRVAMIGGATTAKQTTLRLGPSERFNAVVGDWDKSLLNLPVGESGHVFSKHYKDEWDAYYSGRSFPMQFDHVDAKSILVLRPQ